MRFCTQCGNEIKAMDKFCNKCGAAVKSDSEKIIENKSIEEYSGVEHTGDESAKINVKSTHKVIAVFTVAIVLIIAIVGLFTSVSALKGRGINGTINDYIEAISDADGEDLLELYPKKLVKVIVNSSYNGNMKQAELAISNSLRSQNFGNYWDDDVYENYVFQITSSQDLSNDDVINYISYNTSGQLADLGFSKAKLVNIDITYTDLGYTVSKQLYLGKKGVKWYIFNM